MWIVPFQQVSPSGSCRGSGHSQRLLSSLDFQRCPSRRRDELPEKRERSQTMKGTAEPPSRLLFVFMFSYFQCSTTKHAGLLMEQILFGVKTFFHLCGNRISVISTLLHNVTLKQHTFSVLCLICLKHRCQKECLWSYYVASRICFYFVLVIVLYRTVIPQSWNYRLIVNCFRRNPPEMISLTQNDWTNVITWH